jgi:predicted  nucleic acid-binding Zn-ribbon protein
MIMDYGMGRPTTPKTDLSYAVDELRSAIERGEREIQELMDQRLKLDNRISNTQERIGSYKSAIVQFEHAVELLERKGID